MRKQLLIQTVSCILLGAMLGMVAASGGGSSSAQAQQSPACCSDGLNGQLPAVATEPHVLARLSAVESAARGDAQKSDGGSAQKKAADSAKKPNILVIWGDDIGTWNISHNNRGMMGWRTPNIDR